MNRRGLGISRPFLPRLPRFIAAAALCILLAVPAAAEVYCVRRGAAGDGSGSDWTNAYSELPKTLERGGTYFLADGTYGGYVFAAPAEGEVAIGVYKATEENHGTSLGWKYEFGDGTAEFSDTLRFTTDYWIFDGVTGENGIGYGFTVSTTRCDEQSKLIRIDDGASHIAISYVDLGHCGENTAYSQDCIYSIHGSSHILISHCYLHDVNRVMMLLNHFTKSIITNNLFERRYNDTGIHGEAISMNDCGLEAGNVISNNVFRDVKGTGFIVIKDSVQSHFYIYGNVFHHTGSRYFVTNGAVTNTGGDTNTNMHVVNNTFVGLNGLSTGIFWYNGTENSAYNNIFYDCENMRFAGVNHDYNTFFRSGGVYGEPHGSWESPMFREPTAGDFHLVISTAPGIALGSPFDRDPEGTVRGADGTWDRGAFERSLDGVPSPPTGLRKEQP